MSVRTKKHALNRKTMILTNTKAKKVIEKKKRRSRTDGYMVFYMRYIRAEKEKKDLKARIEELTEVNQ